MVTVKSYETEDVVIDGIVLEETSFLRFEGFRITNYVHIGDRSSQIEIVGNELSPHGVHMRSVDGVLVEGNDIHDLAPQASDGTCGCGIAVRSSRDVGEVRNVTIRENVIRSLAGDGIHVSEADGVVISGNTITEVWGAGGDHVDAIQLLGVHRLVIESNLIRRTEHGIMFTDRPSPEPYIANNVIAETSYGINAGDIPGARIINNTFWGNRWGAAIIRDDPRDPATPADVVFKNNIIDAPHAEPDLFAEHDYNLVISGELRGPNDRRGTPRFVDAPAGDFRLAEGSPGIDAGTSEGAPEFDRAGQPRRDDPATPDTGGGAVSYVDVGAHEH